VSNDKFQYLFNQLGIRKCLRRERGKIGLGICWCVNGSVYQAGV